MTAIERCAHDRLVTERRIWREMALAALDKLHEVQQDNAAQARIIAMLREELRERMGVPNAELR